MATVNTPAGILCPAPGPSNMPAPDRDAPCCWASADTDGEECTCWNAVLDLERTELVQEGPHLIQSAMCGDCAYRPGSPEREVMGGDLPDYSLRDRFYCHQGMPRAVGLRHPTLGDTVIPHPADDDYRPLIRDGQPWQADGSPALLCAGWAAHNGVKPPRRSR